MEKFWLPVKKDLRVKVTSPQSESKTKNMKTPKQPAPVAVFKKYVVPQMLAGLTKYEINEDKWSILVNLCFKKNYSTMSELEKIKIRAKVLRQEENSESYCFSSKESVDCCTGVVIRTRKRWKC